MMMKPLLHIYRMSILLVATCTYMHATVFDNRYIPFLQAPYITVPDRPSHIRLNAFATTTREAFGSSDNEVPLLIAFEGMFDLKYLVDSLVLIGKENPLRPEWRGESIPWNVSGKIQTHGLTFSWHQQITSFLSAGIYWGIINAHSSQFFFLNKHDISIVLLPGDERELEEVRRNIFRTIELYDNHAHQVGMLDADIYLRCGYECDYLWKFRHMQGGIRIGTLLPAGAQKYICSAASIPIGGDGHYGIYGSADLECELKEDLKVGVLLRLEKRFEKTLLHRVPAGKELPSFGVIQGPIERDPGITFVFSPYVSLENLRQGFGVRIRYTLIHHAKDCWSDVRACKDVPAQLHELIQRSDWATDYVSLTAFYDFGKESVQRTFQPIIHFTWDIPTLFMVGHRVAKTHSVSLGVEWNF